MYIFYTSLSMGGVGTKACTAPYVSRCAMRWTLALCGIASVLFRFASPCHRSVSLRFDCRDSLHATTANPQARRLLRVYVATQRTLAPSRHTMRTYYAPHVHLAHTPGNRDRLSKHRPIQIFTTPDKQHQIIRHSRTLATQQRYLNRLLNNALRNRHTIRIS